MLFPDVYYLLYYIIRKEPPSSQLATAAPCAPYRTIPGSYARIIRRAAQFSRSARPAACCLLGTSELGSWLHWRA